MTTTQTTAALEQIRNDRDAAIAQAAAAAAHRREAAERAARAEARCLAIAEVARIEAESKARRAATDAMRKHEIEMAAAKNERAKSRLRRALVAVAAFVMLAGPGAAFAVNGHATAVDHQVHPRAQDRVQLVEPQAPEVATPVPTVEAPAPVTETAKPALPKPAQRWVAPKEVKKQSTDAPKDTCQIGDPLCHDGQIL